MPSFSFCLVFFLDFTWKKHYIFLVQDPIVAILVGLGAITPVNNIILSGNSDHWQSSQLCKYYLKHFEKLEFLHRQGMYTKFQFFGPTSTIKNSHLAIQINQNQSSISFQLSIKTIIMFCSIWAFFRYKRVIGIILSDHLFDFGPSFKCHIQRMERINWIFRCRTLCQIF